MSIHEISHLLFSGLIAVSDWLLNPAVRTHFAYWLPALVIAFWWAKRQWPSRQSAFRQLGQSSYWWNPSTRQDYALILFNRTLFALLGIAWLVLTMNVSFVLFDAWNLIAEPTEPGSLGNSALIISGYTLVVFLLDDASRFLLHWAMHKSDWLWRLHQVHHSATVLTPLTTLRIHPLESVLYQIRGALVHGTAAGSAFFWLGFTPNSWQIWGATIWIIAFNALGANLRHSPIKLSYGKLENWLISPSQHQAHHGVSTMNHNYGSILAIWDRMAGSWRSGKEDYRWPKEAQPLWKQLLLKEITWR